MVRINISLLNQLKIGGVNGNLEQNKPLTEEKDSTEKLKELIKSTTPESTQSMEELENVYDKSSQYLITAASLCKPDEKNAETDITIHVNSNGEITGYDVSDELKDQIADLTIDANLSKVDVTFKGDAAKPDTRTETVPDMSVTGFSSDNRVKMNDDGTASVAVEKWENNNSKNNGCLERIIRNSYDLDKLGIKYGSKEYYTLEKAVMDANPEIYGSEENNYKHRKEVGGTGRNSAVLYDNESLKLPDIYNVKELGFERPTKEITVDADGNEVKTAEDKKNYYVENSKILTDDEGKKYVTVEKWHKDHDTGVNGDLYAIIENNYDLEALGVPKGEDGYFDRNSEKYLALRKGIEDANPDIYGPNGNNRGIASNGTGRYIQPGEKYILPDANDIEGLVPKEETADETNITGKELTFKVLMDEDVSAGGRTNVYDAAYQKGIEFGADSILSAFVEGGAGSETEKTPEQVQANMFKIQINDMVSALETGNTDPTSIATYQKNIDVMVNNFAKNYTPELEKEVKNTLGEMLANVSGDSKVLIGQILENIYDISEEQSVIYERQKTMQEEAQKAQEEAIKRDEERRARGEQLGRGMINPEIQEVADSIKAEDAETVNEEPAAPKAETKEDRAQQVKEALEAITRQLSSDMTYEEFKNLLSDLNNQNAVVNTILGGFTATYADIINFTASNNQNASYLNHGEDVEFNFGKTADGSLAFNPNEDMASKIIEMSTANGSITYVFDVADSDYSDTVSFEVDSADIKNNAVKNKNQQPVSNHPIDFRRLFMDYAAGIQKSLDDMCNNFTVSTPLTELSEEDQYAFRLSNAIDGYLEACEDGSVKGTYDGAALVNGLIAEFPEIYSEELSEQTTAMLNEKLNSSDSSAASRAFIISILNQMGVPTDGLEEQEVEEEKEPEKPEEVEEPEIAEQKEKSELREQIDSEMNDLMRDLKSSTTFRTASNKFADMQEYYEKMLSQLTGDELSTFQYKYSGLMQQADDFVTEMKEKNSPWAAVGNNLYTSSLSNSVDSSDDEELLEEEDI